MRVTTSIILLIALMACVVGCGCTSRLGGVSRTEETASIAPSAFRFFKVPVVDGRFSKVQSEIYAVQPDVKRPRNLADVDLYLSVAAGRGWSPATAQQPFVLLGKLPGGRHRSDFDYRVLEVKRKGTTITCNLDFTYFIYPGAGPGAGQIPYFIAELPGLLAGEYTVVFRVTESYTSDGTNERKPDKAKRDALANQAYSVKFKIVEK